MVVKFIREHKTKLNLNNLSVIKKGDWIDIFTNEDVRIKKGETKFVSTGLTLMMPKGIECQMVLRSSTPKNHKVLLSHSIGIIDNSFRGPGDIIKLHLYAFSDTLIPNGSRIAQIKFVPSQKANIWQKLKWLFSNKLKFKEVLSSDEENRGGYGSTN